jgi:predicted RNA binding protein YcfA (HicA-like mRNA interferase family)
MTNFASTIINEIKDLGYELVKPTKKGNVYKNDKRHKVTVPHRVDSQKSAKNFVNKVASHKL